MKFPLGKVVATPAAMDLLAEQGVHPGVLLQRHENGDWGDCGTVDAQLNDDALVAGSRLFSVFFCPDEKHRVWIITEADRASTCILLPSEY
jgi:hypothetical protein